MSETMIDRTLRTLRCPHTTLSPAGAAAYALWRGLVDAGMDPRDAVVVAFGPSDGGAS